ncbi:MAG: tetratricopeptide repeat protein [Candidatus Aminicenantes bacterium]|nr:tetratricopeptide repeat protein [Candidatus Aminicenantes bacterium]
MKKASFAGAAVLALLIAAAVPLAAQTAADHIRQGDEHYAQFDDAKALEEYLAAAKLEPENYEALWKTARAYFDLGDLMEPKEKSAVEEQRKLFTESYKYARQAVRVNPEDTWGHFFYSAAQGKFVLTQGKKEQINASKNIKAEIEKAIELDPENDLAYHALGLWHRTMAEIGGAKRLLGGLIYGSIPKGSVEEAERYFKQAVELNPEYTNHHLELGRTYLAMNNYDLAKQEFQKTLELPESTSKCSLHKKEAQTELDALKKKGK